ncbi:aminoglycoside phosphotransferase family protein [Aspergillus neoniger CBS 115656]|uniref:Aminoglycoside phosphotransferase domain-containing protein n=1 Tax=Aspergillus neoniger (strain CBS 115656) TaxID=1448310 RepID=A0A318YRQ6_ASPNB|nr:hypothetical protein BO87DRAFT_435161 [Aspergillus neoniger CBS 115656]PYH34740.1 hypothetical protein BO87DRAFT_435161 [Aspergillus neoniger CBS 115656]
MGEDHCSHIFKLAEGGFNKVFLFRTNSGKEVIARIPTPIAGPPHYTTASEVATMAFLRDILGVPVPRVLAYSADSTNPVGSVYIIMKRVKGVSVASRWLSLTTADVASLMKQIAEIEARIFAYPFTGYGSLYRKRELEEELIIPLSFWHGDRSNTKIDRGPWLSPEGCFTSAARRETTCTLQYAKPQPRRTFLLPTSFDIDPSEHTSLLSKFLQLATFLIPKDTVHNALILRHPHLTLNNILLEPGSAKIASIIDWQDSIIFPLFLQAGYPAFCEHDSSKAQTLQAPFLPHKFYDMSSEEQMEAKAKFRSEEANLYYTAATGLYNGNHWSALKIPHLSMRQYIHQQTGYLWDGDVINLRATLVGITTPQVWDAITSERCPVVFSDQERHTAMEEANENDLGIDPEGGTEPANFEEDERDICWRNWPFKMIQISPLRL